MKSRRRILGFALFLVAGIFLGIAVGASLRPLSRPSQSKQRNVSAFAEPFAETPETSFGPAKKKGREHRLLTSEEIRFEFQKSAVPVHQLPALSVIRKLAALHERIRASDVAALAAALAQEELPTRTGVIRMVMSVFAEKDPDAAWTVSKGMKNAQARMVARDEVIRTLAESDSRKTARIVDSMMKGREKESLWRSLIFFLSKKDPSYAWELARLDTARLHDAAVPFIFERWAMREPETARLAAARLKGVMGERARLKIIEATAQTNPALAWEYACGLPVAGKPNPVAAAARYWAQYGDPEEAIQAAMSISDEEERNSAVSGAIYSWAEADPKKALEFAINLEDAALRSKSLLLISGTAPATPELLTALITHLPTSDRCHEAISALFSKLAETNPGEAAAAIKSLPPGSLKGNCASDIARSWARREGGQSELFAWLRQLPSGGIRTGAVRTAFYDIEHTAEAMAALPTLTSEDLMFAVDSISENWSDPDLKNVLRWVSTIPDLPQRADVLQRIVSRWAARDAVAAATWLKEQPIWAGRDRAVEALSIQMVRKDPATAMAWACSIADLKPRLSVVEQVAREWMRENPTDARAWIEHSDLPRRTKELLLR